MLHHGLGHQYITTPKTETGKLDLFRNTNRHESNRMYIYTHVMCLWIPGSSRSGRCRSCVYAAQRGWRWSPTQRRLALCCSSWADIESTTPTWGFTAMIISLSTGQRNQNHPRLWSLSISLSVVAACCLWVFLWAKHETEIKTKIRELSLSMFLKDEKIKLVYMLMYLHILQKLPTILIFSTYVLFIQCCLHRVDHC